MRPGAAHASTRPRDLPLALLRDSANDRLQFYHSQSGGSPSWQCFAHTPQAIPGSRRALELPAGPAETPPRPPGGFSNRRPGPVHGFSGDSASRSSIRLTNSWDRSTISWLSRIRSLRSACAQCKTARVSRSGLRPNAAAARIGPENKRACACSSIGGWSRAELAPGRQAPEAGCRRRPK